MSLSVQIGLQDNGGSSGVRKAFFPGGLAPGITEQALGFGGGVALVAGDHSQGGLLSQSITKELYGPGLFANSAVNEEGHANDDSLGLMIRCLSQYGGYV